MHACMHPCIHLLLLLLAGRCVRFGCRRLACTQLKCESILGKHRSVSKLESRIPSFRSLTCEATTCIHAYITIHNITLHDITLQYVHACMHVIRMLCTSMRSIYFCRCTSRETGTKDNNPPSSNRLSSAPRMKAHRGEMFLPGVGLR